MCLLTRFFVFSLFFFLSIQVGVQCEVEPESNSAALEERVNEILPLQNKDDDDDDDDEDE
jgi:hypothetical protein